MSVTKSGTVYVVDYLGGRVLSLAPGADIQQELPFSGLSRPGQIVVSPAGEVAVADMGNNRIVGLTPGSTEQRVGPFSGLVGPPDWLWMRRARCMSPTVNTTAWCLWRAVPPPRPNCR